MFIRSLITHSEFRMAAMSVQKKSWLDQQNEDQLAARDRYVPALIMHAPAMLNHGQDGAVPRTCRGKSRHKIRSLKLN